MPETKRQSIRIPRKLRERAMAECRRHGKSFTQMVCEGLYVMIEQYESAVVAGVTIPNDLMEGGDESHE